MNDLTKKLIRHHLSYCPETGILTWQVPINDKHRPGDVAGSLSSWGYTQVKINGQVFRAHRIAWMLSHGDWPDGLIDHINGVGTDNRLSNLRLADHRLNCENKRRAQSNSSTGILGVSQRNGRFYARIGVNRKKHHLGVFDNAEDAFAAYLKAKQQLHEGCTL